MPIKIYSDRDFPGYLPKLSLLYDDLFHGGKGFRAKLVGRISENLELSPEITQLLCQTIEFIHNASLLHDDLIDRSILRRGKPAAWHKYTPEYAVLAGDYLLARVMVNLSSQGNIRLVQYTAEIISDLLEGEWLQDSLVGDSGVTVNQLDRVHLLKTGSLFKWCLRAPFIALNLNDVKLHQTLDEMGSILGLLFQRSDDLLDFDVRNLEGKALLGDLKSGYFNSFASFSLQNFAAEARKDFTKCESLMHFKTKLGGEESFLEKVNEFDRINSELIKLYFHHLENLPSIYNSVAKPDNVLPNLSESLVTALLALPTLLYWRKSNNEWK